MHLKSVHSRTLIIETHLAKPTEACSLEGANENCMIYLNDFTFNTLVVVRLCLHQSRTHLGMKHNSFE